MALTLTLTAVPSKAMAADGVEFRHANLESSDDGYRLSASYTLELNRSLEEAIMRGFPLYFTTEVEISRPRWYWFDETAISATHTIRISYNVLTRQYRAAITGNLQQSFDTLEDALALIRRPSRWVVAKKEDLKPGNTYNVAVRMRLDSSLLPKPIQVHALNSSDWRFSSDWKNFTFKAE